MGIATMLSASTRPDVRADAPQQMAMSDISGLVETIQLGHMINRWNRLDPDGLKIERERALSEMRKVLSTGNFTYKNPYGTDDTENFLKLFVGFRISVKRSFFRAAQDSLDKGTKISEKDLMDVQGDSEKALPPSLISYPAGQSTVSIHSGPSPSTQHLGRNQLSQRKIAPHYSQHSSHHIPSNSTHQIPTQTLSYASSKDFDSYYRPIPQSHTMGFGEKRSRDYYEGYPEANMLLGVKKKKKHDPNAPKRSRSAYIFFCETHRKDVKETLGELAGVTDIVKELARRWRECEDKTEYETKAAQDKIRYAEEMKNYRSPQKASTNTQSSTTSDTTSGDTSSSTSTPTSTTPSDTTSSKDASTTSTTTSRPASSTNITVQKNSPEQSQGQRNTLSASS